MSQTICSANPQWLTEQLPPDHWDKVHGEADYYWYLRSNPFRSRFLLPMAQWISDIGGTCIDIGCGEGCLADYVTIPYVGVDASTVAISKANQTKSKTFCVGRFEDPSSMPSGRFRTIVLGNVLAFAVKPEFRIEMLETYRKKYRASYFVVCDIMPLDEIPLLRYHVSRRYEVEIPEKELPEIPQIKRQRKILVLKC